MNFQADYKTGLPKGELIDMIGNDHPKILIELGASDGSDTEHFLNRMGSDDKYFAVEADPRNIQRFKNKNDSRLTLINAAVTNENKENGVFHICEGIVPSLGRPHYDASSLKKPTKETMACLPWLTYSDVNVPYITLDMLAKKYYLDKVDFIWCDVEGCTKEVVQGGLKTLKVTKYFYTEVREKLEYGYQDEALYEEILNIMKKINFELVFKFEYDALFKNKGLL